MCYFLDLLFEKTFMTFTEVITGSYLQNQESLMHFTLK